MLTYSYLNKEVDIAHICAYCSYVAVVKCVSKTAKKIEP